ncbi:MAG: transcriptional repressor [Pirellulaceae bacterium]|nr:transcriptional repressor [Pirellulaceae bacterium]
MESDRVENELRRFEDMCRERGLPLTIQRREILRAVLERDDHPTADQVFDAVKQRITGLSRTTVYRVLDTLVDLGVARRLHHSRTCARFDGRTSRHHHLVCRLCDRVIDFNSSNLDAMALPPSNEHGFRVEDYSVQITGVCAECDRKLSSETQTERNAQNVRSIRRD